LFFKDDGVGTVTGFVGAPGVIVVVVVAGAPETVGLVVRVGANVGAVLPAMAEDAVKSTISMSLTLSSIFLR
jgi:hypothetical protein